ncbi:MAG: DUF58 domain-containing protein [Gammaproteobacteria bacterium]
MPQTASNSINESVHVTVPLLVQLSRFASGLTLRSGRILARQAGDYQSPFKGRGMEFDESRLYIPGDDIRNIDWRVTARTGKTHTKLYREERERPVFVWVDYREPMFFATKGRYKSVIAAHLATLLAWSAIYHGDRVGGVIFSDYVHHELKPHRGKSAVLRMINQLAGHPAWHQNGSQAQDRDDNAGSRALLRLRRVSRPGSLIFLISDFRNLDEAATLQMTLLGRHSDVVMLFIHDPLEAALPSAGRYRVSDGADEVLVDTYDRQRVEAYHRRFIEHTRRLTLLSRKNRMRLISCSTRDDPFTVLQAGLKV